MVDLTAFPLSGGLRPAGRYDVWRPQTPRYVVADVDGTLLGETTRATKKVVDAARAAAAAGLAVGYATGRLAAGVADLDGQLDLAGPHITHNGAQVRLGGRALGSWPLSRPEVTALCDLARAWDLYVELYVGDGFVVTQWREQARPHWEHVTGEPDGLVADVDFDRAEVVKATIVAFPGDDLDALLAECERRRLYAGAATSPLTPQLNFVNVTSPHADKGRALAFAADHLGCTPAQVVAVGDAANDLPLLAVAGTAIAMGQSPQAVVDAAHLLAPAVQADGVASALRAAAAWTGAARTR